MRLTGASVNYNQNHFHRSVQYEKVFQEAWQS